MFADPGQYDALKALPHLAFYDVPTAETGVIRMRCDQKPFDNPKVRKAMRIAIDPDVVLKIALRGLGVVGEHHHCCAGPPRLRQARALQARRGRRQEAAGGGRLSERRLVPS